MVSLGYQNEGQGILNKGTRLVAPIILTVLAPRGKVQVNGIIDPQRHGRRVPLQEYLLCDGFQRGQGGDALLEAELHLGFEPLDAEVHSALSECGEDTLGVGVCAEDAAGAVELCDAVCQVGVHGSQAVCSTHSS